MWTAIMIIALNGQQVEMRGPSSPNEDVCQRAAFSWSWYILTRPPKPVLVDVRCVWSER